MPSKILLKVNAMADASLAVAMARQVHRLSVKQVENVAEPGYHSDGGGLYLQVGRALTKCWIFRYTRADQRSARLQGYLLKKTQPTHAATHA
jgi:hypothetical protein